MTNIQKTFDLEIEVLSPLAINDGAELSPLSDYFIKENKLHYIDKEAFLDLLKDEELQAKYQTGIREIEFTASNKNGEESKKNAVDFINQLVNDAETLTKISTPHSVAYKGNTPINLRTIVKSQGQPYIPGSSLKGAVKNAILFYWLVNEEDGKEYLKKIVTNNTSKFKQIIALDKTIKNLDKEQYKEKRKHKGEKSKVEREIINSFIKGLEHAAFGVQEGVLKSPSSNLMLCDSTPFSPNSVAVASLYKKTLNEKIDDYVIALQEYIQADKQEKVSLQLQIKTAKLDWKELKKASFLKKILLQESKNDLKYLFKILNFFSEAVKDSYRHFSDIRLPDAPENLNEAILPLGSGKGIFANTILWAIKDNKFDFFDFKKDFLSAFFPSKNERENFPNSVSHIDKQAMGWVKIRLKNKTIKKIKENYKRIEKSIVEQLFLEFPEHQPTTGSYREDVWHNLFRQIVPYKFAIAKSVFIIDSEGKISKEVDLAIFDEQYTPYIFNYGNVRFIPIEAVAVVIQCKSNNIDNTNLKGWSDSIKTLKTNTKSVARVLSSVINGWLDSSNPDTKDNEIKDKEYTQTATRPIQILCHLNNGEKNYTKPNIELFDFVICANKKNKKPELEIRFKENCSLGTWYESLNHSNKELCRYKKKYENADTLENKYKVTGNSILSLVFQLNQLLMLINNPMLFPHQAYVKMFKDHS